MLQDSGRSGRSSRRTKSVNNFDYGNGDAYEPNIKVLPKLEQPNGQALKDRSKKILRPRYASTELGIKEKLFVGVLTSRETIDSLGVAINKTLTHYVPKLVFFMDTRGPNLPSGMAVVSFSDEKPYLRPFHMLKYLAAHYAQAYDYYMFIPDTTYVRGEKLLDMLSYISIRWASGHLLILEEVYRSGNLRRPFPVDSQRKIEKINGHLAKFLQQQWKTFVERSGKILDKQPGEKVGRNQKWRACSQVLSLKIPNPIAGKLL